jgi:hypothetical protein
MLKYLPRTKFVGLGIFSTPMPPSPPHKYMINFHHNISFEFLLLTHINCTKPITPSIKLFDNNASINVYWKQYCFRFRYMRYRNIIHNYKKLIIDFTLLLILQFFCSSDMYNYVFIMHISLVLNFFSQLCVKKKYQLFWLQFIL